MTWQPEIDELRKREELGRRMGGPEKIQRQHAGGKLTVRERVAGLLDAGSFHEIGAIAGKARYNDAGELIDMVPTNLVMGRGRIDGRPVVIAGDDFTVRGGANDGGLREKLERVEMMAYELRLPMLRLVDGTGGGGSVKNIEQDGRTQIPTIAIWEQVVKNMSVVPVVSLALGSVAGLGSARVAASHYSVMVKDTSQLFVAGPPVVARVEKSHEKNELGGSAIHTRNGAVDDEAPSESEAFARARRFLSYLPSSVYELPPRTACDDDPGRSDPWLIEAVPKDARKVFGVAGAAHQNSGRYNLRYVWPSGEWGSLPIAGGLEAAYRADIEAAPDPAARMAEIEKRLKALTSPFRSAESFIVEEIIDPRDTRRLLCEFADLAAPLRTPGRTAFGIRP